MNYYVSNLAFMGLATGTMARLPKDIGVEIFCEIGNDYYWNHLIPVLLKDRDLPLSLHGPFQRLDLSDPDGDFEEMKNAYLWAFELCKKFGCHDCVCHPYAGGRPVDDTPEKLELAKQTSLKRILELNEIAKEYDIMLLVENMPEKNGMLDQKAFIELFAPHAELNFLIDTGHANLLDWDMEYAFQTIGTRIRAYHIHDNYGDSDSHQLVGQGNFDWDVFCRGVNRITPNANIVFEYNSGPSMEEILKSITDFKTLLASKT